MQGGTQFSIEDPLNGQNHFTAIRWGLAGAVALGHAWVLTLGPEPFQIHGRLASYMAVNGFFILSGLLIAKSLHMRRDLVAYAFSRLLRIYPALIVVLLAFLLIFRTVFAPDSWSVEETIEASIYVVKVLALGDHASAPAHIFSDNLQTQFNDPLWTIRYELAAYILAAVAFAFGLVNGRIRVLITYAFVQITYLYVVVYHQDSDLPVNLLPMLRLGSCFLLGMTLWHWPELRKPPLWALAGLLVLFAIFGRGIFGEIIANWALTAILMRVGLPKKPIKKVIAVPDYSYGIYIWHFPVMQSILVIEPDLNPVALLMLSAPAFLILAALSWHFIEKPALGFKPKRKFEVSSFGLNLEASRISQFGKNSDGEG